MHSSILIVITLSLLCAVNAFYAANNVQGVSKSMHLAMIFNLFNSNKKSPTPAAATPAASKVAATKKPAAQATAASTTTSAKSSSARFGEYIPAGISKEQYEAAKKADMQKKEENKKKFVRGKVTESLTEWIVKNEEKGLTGVDLNRKGHRMLKMKYDDWYTDDSPV